MKCYLSRLICNNDRKTTLLLSRIITIDIDYIEEESSQFYVNNNRYEQPRIPLRDIPEYNTITKIINMEWCLITRDDLKQLNQVKTTYPSGTIIERDNYLIEVADVYMLRVHHDRVYIDFYNEYDVFMLTNEDNGFKIHCDYGYNYSSQNTYRRYYTDNECSYFIE